MFDPFCFFLYAGWANEYTVAHAHNDEEDGPFMKKELLACSLVFALAAGQASAADTLETFQEDTQPQYGQGTDDAAERHAERDDSERHLLCSVRGRAGEEIFPAFLLRA